MRGRKGGRGGGDDLGIRFDVVLLRSCQQTAALVEPGGTMTVGEKAIMADAMEAVGQCVQEEATDELVSIERHDLRPAVMAIIPPAERDAIVVHADQPGIGDGDAMGIAAEIGQHLLWPTERRLGIDDPFEATDFGEHAGESIRLCQVGKVAEEAQVTRVMGCSQFLQKAPAKQARQHPHG